MKVGEMKLNQGIFIALICAIIVASTALTGCNNSDDEPLSKYDIDFLYGKKGDGQFG